MAKRDQLQFLNSEHGSFANEVVQAIQQLSTLRNTYGDNIYAPVAPNAAQKTLEADALESEFDPGAIVEELAPEISDNADLQAALFNDTDSNIQSRRRMRDAEYNSKVAGLNNSQRDAFDQIVCWMCECHQYFMGECKLYQNHYISS